MTTRSWLLYFRGNQAPPDEIPWDQAEPPEPAIAKFLIPSLQQFQLGEGSSGLTFLELGRRHATASRNLDFVEALALFIAEEQRHSAMLARYLRAVSQPVLAKHWVDRVFRKLRKLAGLECMVTVLVTAEIMAIPYYRAVYRISPCPALRALCRRILREEAQHLRFQAATLESLQVDRSALRISFTHLSQKILLFGTSSIVWLQHGRVLRAASMDEGAFWTTCYRLLKQLQSVARTGETREHKFEGNRVLAKQ